MGIMKPSITGNFTVTASGDEDSLPLIVLNDELGEGEIHIGLDFMNLPTLQQADLLKDWVTKLQEVYESVTSDTFMADMGATKINETPPSGAIN